MIDLSAVFPRASIAIKEWKVKGGSSPRESGKNAIVSIYGRAPGIRYYILKLFMIDTSINLFIDPKNLTLEKGGILGFDRLVLPLREISSSSYGYKKPWIVALVIAIGGIYLVNFINDLLVDNFFFAAIGAGVMVLLAILYFIFNKSMYFSVTEAGEKQYVVMLSNTLTSAGTVDEKQLATLEATLLGLIERAR